MDNQKAPSDSNLSTPWVQHSKEGESRIKYMQEEINMLRNYNCNNYSSLLAGTWKVATPDCVHPGSSISLWAKHVH